MTTVGEQSTKTATREEEEEEEREKERERDKEIKRERELMGSSCVRAAVPTRAPCHFFVGSPSLFPLPALLGKEISQTVESHFILRNASLSSWLFHDSV